MSTSVSNDNISKEKVKNSYDFGAPMYCPYYSMPYTRSIQHEYPGVDTYDDDIDDDLDDDFDPGYRHRGHRRHRHRFPLWPLLFWYWY